MSRRIVAKSRSDRTLGFDRPPALYSRLRQQSRHRRQLRFWKVISFLLGYALVALATVMALSS